jgi:hypothetical protein
MKTKLLFMCIFLFNLFYCIGQNQSAPENNLSKYWWYRYRLWNRFMVVQPNISDNGVFIPAKLINKKTDPNHMSWGDAIITMSYYIQVLATEYKLLRTSGEDYMPTLKELCCALEKIEQLDFKAEYFYGCGNSYDVDKYLSNPNGFFVRDDVPSDFLDTYHDYFSDVKNPDNWKASSDLTPAPLSMLERGNIGGVVNCKNMK